MDIAEITIDGVPAAIVDIDRDGWADGIIMDTNGDGNISENEVMPLDSSEYQIDMNQLAQAANYEAPEDTPEAVDSEVIVVDSEVAIDEPETDSDYIVTNNEDVPDYTDDPTATMTDMTADTTIDTTIDTPIDNGVEPIDDAVLV